MKTISVPFLDQTISELSSVDFKAEGYINKCDLIRQLVQKWLENPRKKLK